MADIISSWLKVFAKREYILEWLHDAIQGKTDDADGKYRHHDAA